MVLAIGFNLVLVEYLLCTFGIPFFCTRNVVSFVFPGFKGGIFPGVFERDLTGFVPTWGEFTLLVSVLLFLGILTNAVVSLVGFPCCFCLITFLGSGGGT
jgi:hypothetical protein